MNVYLIQEDGESNCYQAETPMAAIEAACDRFMASLTDAEALTFNADHGEMPREWFLRTCFQSCSLVGEIVNEHESQALDGCRALLGLIQLILSRDDLTPELREALSDNHRIAEAESAIARVSQKSTDGN